MVPNHNFYLLFSVVAALLNDGSPSSKHYRIPSSPSNGKSPLKGRPALLEASLGLISFFWRLGLRGDDLSWWYTILQGLPAGIGKLSIIFRAVPLQDGQDATASSTMPKLRCRDEPFQCLGSISYNADTI